MPFGDAQWCQELFFQGVFLNVSQFFLIFSTVTVVRLPLSTADIYLSDQHSNSGRSWTGVDSRC